MHYFRGIFMLLMVAMGGYGTLKFLHAPDGAAWIQCIWSVVAVFLAIIVPQWQAEVRERAEYRRQRLLLREIVLSAEVLFQAAAQCDGDVPASNAYVANVNAAKWESVRDSLAAFPVTGLRSAIEVEHLMMVRAAAAEATYEIKRSKTGLLAAHGATQTIARLIQRDAAAFTNLTKTAL